MAKYDVYYGEPEDRDIRVDPHPHEMGSWNDMVVELTDEERACWEEVRKAWDHWQNIIHSRIEYL